MTAPDLPALCPSRRSLLQRALLASGVALAPGALVACSSDAGTGAASSAASSAAGGTVPAADVPVGGALVTAANGAPVVVAQPTQGQYVAMSAICTHQGAVVQVDTGLVLRCPAHGSEFDAGQQGKAITRPATDPLPTIPVTVDGSNLVLG